MAYHFLFPRLRASPPPLLRRSLVMIFIICTTFHFVELQTTTTTTDSTVHLLAYAYLLDLFNVRYTLYCSFVSHMPIGWMKRVEHRPQTHAMTNDDTDDRHDDET